MDGGNGDRDENNNLLSATTALNRTHSQINGNDRISNENCGLNNTTHKCIDKNKTLPTTVLKSKDVCDSDQISPSPRVVKIGNTLAVSMSMPVLCSILWILCLSLVAGNVASQSQGVSENQKVINSPSQILFPEDYTTDDDESNTGGVELQTIEDDFVHGSQSRNGRTGRVLSSGASQNLSQELTVPRTNSSSSEENGSSRKAAPDVQDIIDGIVKLLGGKVHNGTPPQYPHPNQGNRPLTSPNPYNLFNPTKPFFPKMQPPPTPKPSRINNRGPVLPGQQQQPDPQSSFEAIPIEVLSEFNLNKSNFGPPFPISGNGGGVIQPNGGNGGHRVVEPPFKQGVPLPEMLVPPPPPQHHQGQGQSQGLGQQYPQHHGGVFQQQQQQQQNHGGNYFPQQNQQQQQHPVQHTRYQIGNGNGGNNNANNGGTPSYNPFGFEHPLPHPNATPFPSTIKQPTHVVPLPNSNNSSKRPVIKFPTDGEDLEDDEADEARFTTPKVPPIAQVQQQSLGISPTLSSSLLDSSGGVYPTLLLSTNKDNGLVELVTEFSSSSIQPSITSPVSDIKVTNSGINVKPIFYPNNSRGTTTQSTTTTTASTSTTVASSPQMNNHALPTPPLRPGIVISDSPPTRVPHNSPSPVPGAGVGSVEVVTADEGQSLLAGSGGQGQGQIGDIFDVTVTAKQSYGGGQTISSFQVPVPPSQEEEVLTAPKGTEQFVSIDGKRTYFNLHPNTAISGGLSPSRPTSTVTGTTAPLIPSTTSPSKNIGVGSVGAPVPLLPQPPGKTLFNSGTPVRTSPVSTSLSISGGGSANDKGIISKTPPNIIRRPSRPSIPPVRIDTCIVGDDSTCNSDAAEVCRTENGVSSCICRAGYARRRHREPCKAILSLVLSIKLDKLGDKKLNYNPDYFNPSSDIYQTIEWEIIHALDASMAETTLSPSYVGSKMDAIGFDGKHAVVNTTILIHENGKLTAPQLKKELQKQMIQVLTRHRNNFGKSQLWVEGPISAVSAITDLNECEDSELNDCSSKAICINTFGSFECRCESGYGDPWENDKRRGGRRCDSCSGKSHCNGRGECLIENGYKVCRCSGNYYGSQCDIDGEVLAVAIGASVSAVVIIGLTLACLCMWSRKWKKEEQKAALMSRTLFGGITNQALSYLGGQKTNPYQQHVSMDERLRWAQVAESNMTGNIYVQNDPMSMPQCGMGPQLLDTPPMMARRSADTVDTTVDELFDERGGGPSTKRPRSRASQFQGGSIYYDLEPDQTEIYASRSMMHFPPPAQFCVPMTPMGHYASQHTQGRGGFYS